MTNKADLLAAEIARKIVNEQFRGDNVLMHIDFMGESNQYGPKGSFPVIF